MPKTERMPWRPDMSPVIKIATAIAASCIQQGRAISPEKLQALLFYVQAWDPKLEQNDYFTTSFTWKNGLPVQKEIEDQFTQIIADADKYTWPEPDLALQSVVSFYGALPTDELLKLHKKDASNASLGQKRLQDGGLSGKFMQAYFVKNIPLQEEMQHKRFVDAYCRRKYKVQPIYVPDLTASDIARIDALLPI